MTPDEVFQLSHAYADPRPPLGRFVSTGSAGLDQAIGTGGWPIGHLSVIYGEAATGKSALAYATITQMQKIGTVAFINLDRDFNAARAKAMGLDDLLVLTGGIPSSRGWPSGLGLVVVDGISCGEEADRLAEFRNDTWTTVVATSQIRSKLQGVPGHPPRTGGFLEDASVRVRLSKGVSDEVTAEVVRNVYRPVKSFAKFNVGKWGIDRPSELLDLAIRTGLIRTEGAWMYWDSYALGQGRANAQRALQEHPGALDALEEQLRPHTKPLVPKT